MSNNLLISSLPHTTVPDPCASSPCDVNATCVRESVMTENFTCTCNSPFEGNGSSCESKWFLWFSNNLLIISLPHTVPDPCSSSPCDVNATCVRDSVITENFTCTCNSPFEGNGSSCESKWFERL